MGQVTVRLADQLDFPFLREELKAQDVDEVDLTKCITVIAEYEGKPFCSISGQLAWFIEPHMVFNTEGLSDSTIRRGLLMTYRKFAELIAGHQITMQICHVPEYLPKPTKWVQQMGFTRVWDKAIKWFSKD
jgi:hypothetical protein